MGCGGLVTQGRDFSLDLIWVRTRVGSVMPVMDDSMGQGPVLVRLRMAGVWVSKVTFMLLSVRVFKAGVLITKA